MARMTKAERDALKAQQKAEKEEAQAKETEKIGRIVELLKAHSEARREEEKVEKDIRSTITSRIKTLVSQEIRDKGVREVSQQLLARLFDLTKNTNGKPQPAGTKADGTILTVHQHTATVVRVTDTGETAMVPHMVPATDDTGEPVLDDETGEPVMVPAMVPDVSKVVTYRIKERKPTVAPERKLVF